MEVQESDKIDWAAEPGDEDYRQPTICGCWFCYRGDGQEDDDMSFDIEFDTFYHDECLERTGYDSVLEYERA